MGLFDIFKRNKKEKAVIDIPKKGKDEMTIEQKDDILREPQMVEYLKNAKFSITSDGKLQIDFHDLNPKFGQYYDMTRLIIDGETTVCGSPLKECKVSWYGSDDAIMFDKRTGYDLSRRTSYMEVLAQIDLNLMRTDPNYCEAVMKKLLKQSRVNEKLNMGLEENPEVPCGNYVGGIMKTEEGYQKFFNGHIGEAVHNSKEMKIKRDRHRRMKEEYRQKQIAEKRAKIEKLQSEIDAL